MNSMVRNGNNYVIQRKKIAFFNRPFTTLLDGLVILTGHRTEYIAISDIVNPKFISFHDISTSK